MEGSFIEINTTSLPARIKVQVTFDAPYEDLNFSYNVDITVKPQLVNIYSPHSGTISVVEINNKDEEVGTPLVVTSTEFWDNVHKDDPGLLGQMELTGSGGSIPWLSGLLLAIAAVLFVFCMTLILKRR